MVMRRQKNSGCLSTLKACVWTRWWIFADEAYIIHSLAGHSVTGLATEEEVRAFREFYAGMDPSQAD
jgi:hypothetical protein